LQLAFETSLRPCVLLLLSSGLYHSPKECPCHRWEML
jgi:hypothetical protein